MLPTVPGSPIGDGHVLLARLQELLGEELDEPRLVTIAFAEHAEAPEVQNALRSIGLAVASLYCADYYARASGCKTANLVAALAVRLRYQIARQLVAVVRVGVAPAIPAPGPAEGGASHIQQEDLSMRLVGAVYESNGVRASFALLDWAVARIDAEDWLPGGDYSRFLSSYSMLRFGIAPWQTKTMYRQEDHARYESTIRTIDRNEATGSGPTRIQAERTAGERYVQTHLAEVLVAATSLPPRDMHRPPADVRLVANEGALAALARAYAPSLGMVCTNHV
jgi:hypothetical protein